MDKLTEGGTIYTSGNAKEFKTGDWRSTKPVYLQSETNNYVTNTKRNYYD